MIQRFTRQLPLWARPEHPVLRYQRGRSAHLPRHVRYLRALGVVLLAIALLIGGYLAATNLLRSPAGQNPVEALNNILFFPLLSVQLLLRVAAVSLTASTVAEEIRRQNWDNLRATAFGAELTLRSRWATVFYRLRGLIGMVLLLRFVLILGMLWDLTAFQGRYLDLLISGIVPEVGLVASVLLLSLMMTAALLLPVTGVGFDASIGLLISSLVQGRTYSLMIQSLWILLRLALTIGLVFGATRFLDGTLVANDLGAWGLMFALGASGDWGLAFLYLGRYGEIWATVPYGIFLGLALVIFALMQAFLADQILAFAVRRAQAKG